MDEPAVTNWAGNIAYGARERCAPTSVDQVQDVVRDADQRGMRVRVLGTGHSFNELADTDGVHLSLRGLPRRIVPAGESVTIDGGATYAEVSSVLAEHGRALANLASLPHITVAGAIATATHGSGDTQRSLASAVRSLTFVTPQGELFTVRRGDSGFENYPVHLGLFGPIVELELDTVPAFEIATTVYEGLDLDVVAEHLDELTGSLYSFSLAPDWTERGRSLLFAKRRAPLGGRGSIEQPQEFFGGTAASRALHPSPGADPVAVTEQLGVAGPSHERLTHFRSDFAPSVGDEIQSEYLVPRRHAAAALRTLPQFTEVFARLAHSMEIRSVAADDLPASPMFGTDVLAIHLTWRRDVPAVRAELPALEEALRPFEARPHWGKVHTMNPDRIAALFPRLHTVDAAARAYDPHGMFRNRWVEQTFSKL